MPNRNEDGLWIKFVEGTKEHQKKRGKAWDKGQAAIQKLSGKSKAKYARTK